jgi:hypothetical protein
MVARDQHKSFRGSDNITIAGFRVRGLMFGGDAIFIPTIVVTGADTELQEMAADEGAFADLPKTFGGET